MMPTKSKEVYIKFDSNDKNKFVNRKLRQKATGTRKHWVKVLTKESGDKNEVNEE